MDEFAEIRSRIDWSIADGDPMLSNKDAEQYAREDELAQYAKVGASALRCIKAAQMIAEAGEPGSILDFACATGRVTRWLRAAFPEADLHVSDIAPEWYSWSADTFNATGWTSSGEFHDLIPPRKFDLIWCGSLATHTSKSRTTALIQSFHNWLNPNGIALVTMHGRRFVDYALRGVNKYFEDMDDVRSVLGGMAFSGYGYHPHPGQDQGISAATPEWAIGVTREIGARLVSFCEHGWDNHQDVIAFQRIP